MEALISERSEVSSAYDMKISALTKERDELSEKTSDKIELLTKERDELLEKVDAHENVSSEISSSSKALHEELESLRKMLNQSELAKQELETKLS